MFLNLYYSVEKDLNLKSKLYFTVNESLIYFLNWNSLCYISWATLMHMKLIWFVFTAEFSQHSTNYIMSLQISWIL